MQKNVAGQKWRVFAFDRTNNTPKTGDAANITAKIAKDWGTKTAVADTNPTETEDGYYEFDMTQSESNGNVLDLYPESSTANIQVIGVPGSFVTTPPNFSSLSISAGGLVDILQTAADKVWSSSTRTLTAFSTALALSVWNVLESAIVTASTIGLKVKNNLDAAITSRQPSGNVDLNADQSGVTIGTVTTNADMRGTDNAATEAKQDIIDTVVDIIAARLTAERAAYLDNLNGHMPQTADHTAILAAIAGYIDTEITDIINHLTDIKGTSFVKDTHSLKQVLEDVTGIDGAAMRGTDGALTDKTGFSLSTAGILAIWHQSLTTIITAGTIGKLFKDEITPARMAVLTDWINDGRLDALLDAIKEATDLIAATPATESYAADGAEATLVQINYMILSFLTSLKFVGTTGTARKLDGSTTAMTFMLDDASNPTDIDRST